jgi:hypothetical protein
MKQNDAVHAVQLAKLKTEIEVKKKAYDSLILVWWSYEDPCPESQSEVMSEERYNQSELMTEDLIELDCQIKRLLCQYANLSEKR